MNDLTKPNEIKIKKQFEKTICKGINRLYTPLIGYEDIILTGFNVILLTL